MKRELKRKICGATDLTESYRLEMWTAEAREQGGEMAAADGKFKASQRRNETGFHSRKP